MRLHHGYVHREKIEIATRRQQFIFTDRNGREITADSGRLMPCLE